MRRLAVVVAALAMFVLPSTAHAWTWPAPGDVLAPFVVGGDPYAGGQHRGIDVEGEKAGVVLAPASGVVAFAGSVGANGKVVTIETDDGYSVTLVHLGAFSVGKGDAVGEGAPVGTIGPSGTPEHDVPYVHLGVRVTSDSQGYVDPLTLLPPRAAPAPPTAAEPCSATGGRAGPTTTGPRRPARRRLRRPSHNRPRLRHRQARMRLRRRSSLSRSSSPLPRHRRTRRQSPCLYTWRSLNRSPLRRAPAVAVCFWSLRFQSLELSALPRRCQLRSCTPRRSRPNRSAQARGRSSRVNRRPRCALAKLPPATSLRGARLPP